MFSHQSLKESENNRNLFSKGVRTAHGKKRAEAENPVLCDTVASEMTLSRFNASSIRVDEHQAYIHLWSMCARTSTWKNPGKLSCCSGEIKVHAPN